MLVPATIGQTELEGCIILYPNKGNCFTWIILPVFCMDNTLALYQALSVFHWDRQTSPTRASTLSYTGFLSKYNLQTKVTISKK